MSGLQRILSRVRIHGGDSGVSARATHHIVQKDLLITYVSALSARAELRTVRGSTTERKKMSTKTSFKRVALVAVAALGMGVLTSVSPAKAAAGAEQTATVSPIRVSFTDTTADTVPAGTISFFNNSGAEIAADNSITLTVTQAPTSAAQVSVVLLGQTVVDTLGGSGTQNAMGAGNTSAAIAASTTVATTASIAITSAPASGTYKGTLVIGDAVDTVTANWSFTTAGKATKIVTDLDTVGLPAVDDASSAFVVSKAVVVSLQDANGVATQPSTGDSISASLADYTNISFAWNGTSAVTISADDLADGKHTLTVGSRSAVADTEVITLTPAGVLPATGVVAKTLTASTVAYGSETAVDAVLSAPTDASVVKNTSTTTTAAYSVDTSVTKLVYTVSGYVAGAAYNIAVVASGSTTDMSVSDDTNNGTATAVTNGTDVTLYGIVGASGKVTVTVTAAQQAANDTIGVSGYNGDADVTDAADALVTFASAAYTVSFTSPAVSPILAKTSAALTASGKVVDQFGNPLAGANVVVTAETDDAADTNPSASAITSATGTWTVTLAAVSAATTTATLVVAVTKAGSSVDTITNSDADKVVVNFNATGVATAITWSAIGDEDSALTATTLPALAVLYEGATASGGADVSDATYTIATDTATVTASADFCVAITPTTTPAAIVEFKATAGVKYGSTCTSVTLADLTDTITVASGSAAYVFATKAGKHTVTFGSGSLTKTAQIVAYSEQPAAARNVAPKSSTLALTAGEIGYVTVAITDAFGNAIKNATGLTVSATVTGAALLDGPAISKSYTSTDASGNIIIGVIAGGKSGTATITVSATGNQFKALAGQTDPAQTVAGTSGLTASVASASVAVTVGGDVSSLTTLVNSLIKKINAMQSLLNKIQKKLGIK